MALTATHSRHPFDHWIIDDFVSPERARKISREFPDHDDTRWFEYGNDLERKKALREWGVFGSHTYQLFVHLCSREFVEELAALTGHDSIVPDYGLHGAGLHMQQPGDYLNVHLDYSSHPYLGLCRKFNLILYLNEHWQQHWGGDLEFWSHDPETHQPRECCARIAPVLGRAVIFDTTQHSWHGVPEKIMCPPGQYRRSVAMYYLSTTEVSTEDRPRALYAPRPEQRDDPEIQRLIKQRGIWTRPR